MSYWVGVEIDTGGREAVEITDRNVTYNNSLIFEKALGFSLRDLEGKVAGEQVEALKAAAKHIRDEPEVYKPLGPDNNWGGPEDAADCLEWLALCGTEHPKATLYIH